MVLVFLFVYFVDDLVGWFGHASILVVVMFACLLTQGFFGWYFCGGDLFVCLFPSSSKGKNCPTVSLGN